MTKYLAIIADIDGNPDYLHPSELNANSKQEVQALLSENVDPASIIQIFTIQEYQNFLKSKQFSTAMMKNHSQLVQSDDGNAFLNNMIEEATAYAHNLQEETTEESSEINTVQNVPASHYTNIENQMNVNNDSNSNILEFEDNGNKYKVENNHMYKKVWKTVLINPNDPKLNDDVIDGNGEFRIINNKTNKEIDYTKYSLQKLDWQLVK